MSKRRMIRVEERKGADQRAYEASSTGRRLGQWDAPSLSPTAAATTELDSIRRRSRAGKRNNPWISRGIRASIANEIGTGIIPRPATSNKEFNSELTSLWLDHQSFADVSSPCGAYGIQKMAREGRKVSGEVFIRILRKRADKSMPVPLQFQVIEADHCPTELNSTLPNGNQIISGVEVNDFGVVMAYWLYKTHPSDGFASLTDLVRVKAGDIIHHFLPERPGQLRGVPEGATSMVRAYVADQYDSAELGRKESRANFTGVIRRPEYGSNDYKFDPISGAPIDKDAADVPMIDMEPGTFPNLLPGEDITLFEGDDAGRGYMDYQRYQLMGIAAGYNVPYQLLSGDYSEINDRVWRAIMNQYHREVEQEQALCIIPQVCHRMWVEFVDRAIMSGAIDYPASFADNRFDYLRTHHRPPAWKHIHPTQDIEAKVLEIKNGLKSRSKIIDESSGENIEQVDEQRAEDQAREKRLNLNEDNEDGEAN